MENFEGYFERRIDPILDAEYIKQLGSLGLYDARLDTCDSPPHPEDNRWPENPNIIKGNE